MKKILITLLCTLCIAIVPTIASAASFTKVLQYGMPGSADVVALQQFLATRGFFKEPATGNFFEVTKSAVSAFQVSVGIDPTGYFGPLTMAAANKMLLTNPTATTQPSAPKTKISTLSVKDNKKSQSASLIQATIPETKTIIWQTEHYPEQYGVDIQLLKKVSESPAKYDFVQMIVTNTPDDGKYVWTPNIASSESLYVQIACTKARRFTEGCSMHGAPQKLY